MPRLHHLYHCWAVIQPRSQLSLTELSFLAVPAGTHVLDEAERSLHDALCVLSQTVVDRRVLLGGGWPEMAMSHAVHQQVSTLIPSRQSLAGQVSSSGQG